MEEGVQTLAGDAGEVGAAAAGAIRPFGGGGRSGGGGASRLCNSAASFSSVAFRSAIRSDIRSSRSLSSSSLREAGGKKIFF